MFSRKSYENLYEGEDGNEEKRKNSYTEEDGKAPNHYNPIPEFTKNEIQDAIDRL